MVEECSGVMRWKVISTPKGQNSIFRKYNDLSETTVAIDHLSHQEQYDASCHSIVECNITKV